MSLPALTAASSLRDPEARAGRATAPSRGLVPAEPFCIRAQFYNGDQPIGTWVSAEAKKMKYVAAARAEATQRVRTQNPGLSETGAVTIRTTIIDRARDRIAFNTCRNAAAAANINDLF